MRLGFPFLASLACAAYNLQCGVEFQILHRIALHCMVIICGSPTAWLPCLAMVYVHCAECCCDPTAITCYYPFAHGACDDVRHAVVAFAAMFNRLSVLMSDAF